MLYTIRHYTREAGVRSLERVIAKVCRKVAREVVLNGSDYKRVIDESVLTQYLGPIKFKYGVKEQTNEIGLANGLAWTEVGGDILNIEASLIKGKGKLTLTGKLGEVMQESAQAAFTYVKANQQFFNINDELLQEQGHPPARARGRDSQGRSLGRHHHGGGHGLAPVGHTGPLRRRHDRRDHPAGQGASDRRPQGEDPGRAPGARSSTSSSPRKMRKTWKRYRSTCRERMIFHPVSTMEEVLFLALESPEKFFKDEKKTRILYDRWKGTLDDWKVEIRSPSTGIPRAHVAPSRVSAEKTDHHPV